MAQLVFTVDGALLSELGEKLVETPHVALVELVKNAYDADATQVKVKIVPDPPRGPQVHIIDNGSGMTYSDVQNHWMRIATTHKLTQQFSERYGRPRTGSKGIGRFSCRRLGQRLMNDTKRVNATNTLYVVHFASRDRADWYMWALAFLSSEARRQISRIGRRYPSGLIKYEPGPIKRVVLPRLKRDADHKSLYVRAVAALLAGKRDVSRRIADSALA